MALQALGMPFDCGLESGVSSHGLKRVARLTNTKARHRVPKSHTCIRYTSRVINEPSEVQYRLFLSSTMISVLFSYTHSPLQAPESSDVKVSQEGPSLPPVR